MKRTYTLDTDRYTPWLMVHNKIVGQGGRTEIAIEEGKPIYVHLYRARIKGYDVREAIKPYKEVPPLKKMGFFEYSCRMIGHVVGSVLGFDVPNPDRIIGKRVKNWGRENGAHDEFDFSLPGLIKTCEKEGMNLVIKSNGKPDMYILNVKITGYSDYVEEHGIHNFGLHNVDMASEEVFKNFEDIEQYLLEFLE